MPPEQAIREVLLRILGQGLLRVRAAAFSGSVEQCALEADHIHNLPELARTPSIELLRYYFGAERPAFLRRSVAPTDELLPLWAELQELLGDPR